MVDYLLLSSNFFSIVQEFEIQDFNPLLSDVHCAIHVTLKVCNNADKNKTVTQHDSSKPKWFDKRKNEFVNTVHNKQDQLTQILNDLEKLRSDEHCSQTAVNNIVDKICNIFQSSADDTFFNKSNSKARKPNSKPWFTKNCENARKKFHKARKQYNLHKNDVTKTHLLNCSKQYKQTTKKAYDDYQFKLESKIRETSKTNGKEFWKILNSFNKCSKDDSNNISLESLYNHFKELNTNVDRNDDIVIDIDFNNLSPEMDELLNSSISADEIRGVVHKLKNGKSAGSDNVLNEYIKYTLDDMLPIYVLLFNTILDTGFIPENWGNGIMIPVYKNKGSKLDPSSYRGITLNSCLSKTFTAVLNNRLNKFSDEIELITCAQTGFRKGFSTVDNIFVLHALISIYFSLGKKLFCSFIDFKSAFDTVWRTGLWQKLQKSDIQGKLFRVIFNMYQNIKTCIRKGHECSGFFNCEVGVKQGENMSPFLFSLFLNDLEKFFFRK